MFTKKELLSQTIEHVDITAQNPVALVEAMQRRGVRVSVVSTITSQPPMVADELRRQADEFIDIVQLVPRIGRDPSERAERPPRIFERRTTTSSPTEPSDEQR